MRRWTASLCAVLLAACASGPPPPDWQANAKDSLERAVAAYLKGDARVADAEFARAKGEIARTGRADLLARAELMQCAARVASLVFEPCAGFDQLRPDAQSAERAYADFLAGRIAPQEVALLPPAQRAAAAANTDVAGAAVQDISDPLSRLVAAGVLLQSGRAGPAVIAQAIDTASAQGWRRPLLAWLHVQVLRAEKAGDAVEAERLRRRIRIVEQGS
jgi:hypothetical protein